MRIAFFLFLAVALLVGSCGESSTKEGSNHPYAEFYYPFDTIAKTYCYRDTVHGLDELFKRVYGVKRMDGMHYIIETYADRGRLRDVLVVDLDSLKVLNYSVMNGSNLAMESELYKDKIYPRAMNEKTWFAAKYPGFIDSTLILEENKRTLISDNKNIKVMGKGTDAIQFRDTIRWTMIQPFTQMEQEMKVVQYTYFAKGIGLVEFFGEENKAHYVLEKILDDEDWVKIIRN